MKRKRREGVLKGEVTRRKGNGGRWEETREGGGRREGAENFNSKKEKVCEEEKFCDIISKVVKIS